MVKTINQSYQEKYQQDKKRKILKKIFLFLVLFCGGAGGLIYALFFSYLFNIKEISISTAGLKNQEVRSLVDGYLSEKKFLIPRFSNIFLANTEQISALISQQFPAVENIKVEKKYFHALEISMDLKEAVGIWCYRKDKSCFYFDRQGTAFDSVGETSGALLLNINDERDQLEELGQPVASSDLFNLIFQASNQFKKIKIEVLKFIIPATEDFRLDAQTAEGWKIYLSTKDDLTRQIDNLQLFLAQKIMPEKRSQLQYIDLTVPNRVYYK